MVTGTLSQAPIWSHRVRGDEGLRSRSLIRYGRYFRPRNARKISISLSSMRWALSMIKASVST